MRILIHDYAGHPFQVELSRWLAARGHRVLHLYSADVETPRGGLSLRADDPPGLSIEAVTTGRPLPKYRLVRRWLHEMRFGRRLAARAAAFRPQAVLSANAPPAVQQALLAQARRDGARMICWVQDIFALAAERALARLPAPLRRAVLAVPSRMEFETMRRADGLVVISPDFVPILARLGVRHAVTEVIENWAPKGEIVQRPKHNAWARRHGLENRFVFLCSGTLGLKHNPHLLIHLAKSLRDDADAMVVVVSQGTGRAHLEAEKAAGGLDNLLLLDFQPYEDLPDVLGAADVLVVLLEEFAGELSVPSKVYSSFCARRPILAAIPAANLARRLIERQEAGLCAAPGDVAGFLAAARRLRHDPGLRAAMAARQADHAETAFDMEIIGPRFEALAARGADLLSGG